MMIGDQAMRRIIRKTTQLTLGVLLRVTSAGSWELLVLPNHPLCPS